MCLEKEVEDGLSASSEWETHIKFPGSWIQPGPAPVTEAIWAVNKWAEDCYLSASPLFCQSVSQIKYTF